MATYNLNLADEHLIEQITDLDALTNAIPRIQTFLEGVKEQRAIIADQGHAGRFTRSTGWWQNGSMQYLGTLPVSVKAAIEQIDPDFFNPQTPQKALKFFSAHPEYIVSEVQL